MSREQRVFLLVSLSLLGACLVFQVPYLYPPTVRAISASYDYGFNNSVGILLLCIIALLFVGLGFLTSSGANRIHLLERAEGVLVTQRELMWACLLSVLTVGLCAGFSGAFGYAESTQFIQAMERLAAGEFPYIDFDFYYGPLLAYIPFVFQQAGNLIGLSSKNSYFVTLLLLQIISLFELKYLLNAVELPGQLRRWAFWLVALSTLPLHSGINLILLRYITPLVGFIFLKQIEGGAAWRSVVVTALLVLLTFGISVEYGTVFTLTVCVYQAGLWLMERRMRHAVALTVALLMPAVFWLIFPGLFHTVHLYLMGAWRWPFVPSPVLVTFFGAVFVLAYAAGQHLRKLRRHFFFLSLCLLAFGSLPAALGRCDPMHVLLNGLGILLLAYVALAGKVQRQSAGRVGLVLVLVFGVLLNLGGLLATHTYYGTLAFRMLVRNMPPEHLPALVNAAARVLQKDPSVVQERIEKSGLLASSEAWSLVDGIPKAASPYLLAESQARYLRETGKLQTLYFKDYAILASEPEVTWAIRDLEARRPQYLALPILWRNVAEAQDYRVLINGLFTSYYAREPFRNSNALLKPLVDHILARYEQVGEEGAVVLMRRRVE